MWVNPKPLASLGVQPQPAGDVGALTPWGPLLLLAAGEAAPTVFPAPRDTPWGLGLCLQQPEKRQLTSSDWDAALSG